MLDKHHSPIMTPEQDNPFELYRVVNPEQGTLKNQWATALRDIRNPYDVDMQTTSVTGFRAISIPGQVMEHAVSTSAQGNEILGKQGRDIRAARLLLGQTVRTALSPYSMHPISNVPVLENVVGLRGKNSLTIAWLVDTSDDLLRREASEVQNVLGSNFGIYVDSDGKSSDKLPLVPYIPLARFSSKDAQRHPNIVSDVMGVAREIRPSTVNVSSLRAFGQPLGRD